MSQTKMLTTFFLAVGGGLVAPLHADPSDAKNACTTLHPMHAAVASFGAAVHDGYVYVAGGHVGQTHSHSMENLSGELVRYPLSDLGTPEVLPANAPLQSVALVSAGADLLRIGGMTAANATALEDEELHSVVEVSRLDDSGGWSAAWPLPAGRSSHDAVQLGGRVFVFGGWRLEGEAEPHWYGEGVVLDPRAEAPEWRAIEQPFRRRALAVAAADGRIFCIGGMTDAHEISRRVDVYDVAAERWSLGPELPCDGFGIAAVGMRTDGGERVFVAGTDGVLYRLADDGAGWDSVAPLALARMFARLVVAREPGEHGTGELALIGGVAHGRHVAMTEVARTGAPTPEPAFARLELAFPGDARQRSAAFVIEDELFLFGGNRSAEAHRFGADDFSSQGWKVDLLTGATTRVADLPAGRQSLAVAVSGGLEPRAYLAGGFGFGESDSQAFAEVFAYDPAADRLEPVEARLPHLQTHFQLAAHRGRLFTFGGLTYDESGGSSVLATAASWHPNGEQPSFVDASFDLGGARRAYAGTVHGGEYVMVGGMGEGFAVLDSAVAVDLATGASRPFPCPSPSRVSGRLVDVDGTLFLVGGSSHRGGDSLAPDRTVERFDAETGEWVVVASELPLDDARHLQAFAWRGRLLIATAAREGKLDLVWLAP